ncbi:tetratricopeptide repeat protein [Sphaerisporangium sp. B11E5]|uniref:tetratricopeptide repeat protein n=1 Tax=Sphaerisporangium sp. B11E5 TaxID=3153563 RepID=UPI00325E326C
MRERTPSHLLTTYADRLAAAGELRGRGALREAAEALSSVAGDLSDSPLPDTAPVHRLRFAAWRDLAEAMLMLGAYDEAESILRTAGEYVAQMLGPDCVEVAVAANDLGVVHKTVGQPAEARRMYAEAHRILAGRDPESYEMATLLHNLAGLAHSEGRSAEGERDAREAVRLRTALLGAGHIDVAADLANLGALLEAQGKLDEAEACFDRALATFETVYGRRHREVAFNLGCLAAIAERRGLHARAEDLYLEALAIQRSVVGDDHPETMGTLNNLAYLYLVSDRHAKAREAYRTVVALLEPKVTADHPVLRSARGHLAELTHLGRP